jgi:hypothetical protein
MEKNQRMAEEIHALGEYNAFSRPKASSVSPTSLLEKLWCFESIMWYVHRWLPCVLCFLIQQ